MVFGYMGLKILVKWDIPFYTKTYYPVQHKSTSDKKVVRTGKTDEYWSNGHERVDKNA